ncbi:MAG: hypothetical protein ABW036_08455 [Flavitalea sp.]
MAARYRSFKNYSDNIAAKFCGTLQTAQPKCLRKLAYRKFAFRIVRILRDAVASVLKRIKRYFNDVVDFLYFDKGTA